MHRRQPVITKRNQKNRSANTYLHLNVSDSNPHPAGTYRIRMNLIIGKTGCGGENGETNKGGGEITEIEREEDNLLGIVIPQEHEYSNQTSL